VRFEVSRAGAGIWRNLGSDPTAPYSRTFDTLALANGTYDLRAVATDRVGNAGVSELVKGVVIANPATPPRVAPSLDTVRPPAEDVRLLGSIASSAQHETWATGFTTGPPAEIDGARLPYRAQGDQPVLLRYTDAGGWQIADVLRDEDGHPFPLLSVDEERS